MNGVPQISATASEEQQKEAFRFLSTLYADALEQKAGVVNVWTLPEKASSYHNCIDEAFSEIVRPENRGCNVYIALGLCQPGLGPWKRASANQVNAIPGLAADLDRAKPSGGKAYPPDDETILAILAKTGDLKPTAIIESGGGLQAWWLFKEPWVFDRTAERKEAATLSRRWSHTLRARAAGKGFTFDGVGDLARVFRAPGTLNNKYDPAREVRVVEFNEARRYNPDDFDTYLIEAGAEDDAGTHPALDLDLSYERTELPRVVEFLIHEDDRFRNTWERQRRDFEEDRSGSAYDMSLASMMAYHGCTPQEIADAIFLWRTKHDEKPGKGRRLDYLERTIGKARQSQRPEEGGQS